MSHMTGVEAPELIFSPFPHEAVDLVQRAEEAIAKVPRSPELIDYDVNGVTVPLFVNGRTPVPGVFLDAFIEYHELPVDFVSYDDPISDTKNIVITRSDHDAGSFERRRQIARARAGDASNDLLSRAHFVAAVIANGHGFSTTREYHMSLVEPRDELHAYDFECTDDPERILDNDHALLRAITYPRPIEDTILGRKIAELIHNPELSLIAHSELYRNGDFESFNAMMAQAQRVLLDPEYPTLSYLKDDQLERVYDWFSEMSNYAFRSHRMDDWAKLELFKADLMLRDMDLPGRNLLRHISSCAQGNKQ